MSDIPPPPPGYTPDQPALPAGWKLDAPAPVNTNAVALGGADMDEYFSQGSAGAILDAFGQGAKDAWGTRPLGIDPDTEKWLNKYAPDYGVLGRAFHDQIIRPSAAAVDAAMRGFGSVVRGASEPLVRGGVPPELTPEGMFEAFPLGHVTGFPGRVMPPEIARAADLGVIGKGEAGYQGLPSREAVEALKPTGIESATERVAASEPTRAIEAPASEPPAEAGPDIHEIARGIAPDTFAKYDTLAAQKDSLRGMIDDLAAQRDRGASPEIAALDTQIDELRARRLEAPASERRALADQVTALEDQRAHLADALPKTGDTPDMAMVRRDLQTTDFALRDLAPDVSAAYRRAAEPESASEAPTEAPGEPEAVPAPPESAISEQTPPAPAAATAEPIPGGIAGDVSKQLVAAGRPAEEANAAAALVQAHYEARAERFGGAKGTAEDLYRADAPRVVAGRGVTPAEPAVEMAQVRRGKIRLATDDAKATITLFKDADASTFIHETGHHWLEELVKDAADEKAPPDLKTDAATVRQWLGAEGGEIPTKAHEKFARGFERYMMEGHAPSSKLAEVFGKFRDWLTRIYETVSRLRAPINDDIRGVFDRLVATKGETPVIAPERPTATFADVHNIDANTTPPPQAGGVADLVRSERDKIMEAAHPEIEDERVGARSPGEDGGSAAGSGVSRQSGAAAEPDTGPAGRVSERSAVGPSGGNAAAAGNRVSGGRNGIPDGPNAKFGPADDRLIDKAGNIRLDNLNQPADIDAVIRDAAERNSDFTTERRGVVSDGQLLDLADALGKDPAFLDEKKIGAAFNAEEVLAARKLLVQSATSVRDAMVKAASGVDADLAALAQAITRHEMIQGKVAQATAEWGRAGRAFRNLDGWEQARDLNQFLKENGGRDLNQLRQMAQLGKSLSTPGEVSKLVADTAGGKVRQAIIYYWVNTLISGPITHLTYGVGNTINALWTPLVETPLAATSGAIREALGVGSGERVYFAETSAQLYGLGKGFRDGLRAGIEAYKNGVSPPLPGERIPAQFLAPREPPIPGVGGQVIGVPGRAVAAIHSLFKSVRYEQNIQALAMRDALDKGLEGNARDLHIARLTASPSDAMMESAVGDALKELYMRRQPYNSPGAYLTRLTNSWLPLKIVAPFVKIGSEIVRNAFVERTPLGVGSPEIRGNLTGQAGGAALDTQLGKVMAGTGLLAATVLGVLEGNVTGDGPSDPNERRVWLLTHQPNHITVGPLSFSYARLGHLGMLMRFASNMTETADRWSDEDGPKLAHGFFDGISRSVLDETWMRGVKDVFDAIYHSDEHFDRWVTGFVAQWSPFSIGLGQIARKVDPYQRETRDLSTLNEIFNQFRAHTPWLSQSLPPRRDIFGEPITTDSGTVDRYAADKVTAAMNDLHIGIATPQRKIRGVDLTPQQYDDYSRLGGRLAKMQLDAIVGPAFRTLPPEMQIKTIRDTVSHAHEAAAAQVMMQSVGSANDIIAKATDSKAAALHGASHLEVKEKLKTR